MKIEKPKNVRLVQCGDERALYNFIESGHKESAVYALSSSKVNSYIDAAINRTIPIIIGIIDSPTKNEIAASICISYEQQWYTDEWHLGELWNNVRPDYRKSNYAKDLIQFGKWVSDTAGKAFNMGIVTTDRMEAKIRLYRRQELKQVGAYFMYNMDLAHGPAITEKYSSVGA